MIVRAGQHIYGNVENEVSPNSVGGFQTLYYTSSMITREESEEIERRLIYHFSDTDPIKLLFFVIDTGKFVVSRVAPLPDVDGFGRSGIYLAHSFVFSGDEFIRLNCNPFVGFRVLDDRFVRSTSEALRVSEVEGVGEGTVLLDIAEPEIRTMEMGMLDETLKWDAEQLRRLSFGAITCLRFKEERKSLAIVGTSEDIENALRVVFSLLPGRLRLNCTFDTHFYRCNPVANYFWALGYPPSSSVSPGFTLVDATQRVAESEAPSSNLPYDRWVFDRISHGKLEEICIYRDAAFELQRVLLGEPFARSLLLDTSADFVRGYVELNWSHVAAVVENRLRRDLGVNLCVRLRNRVLDRCRQLDPANLIQTLVEGFAREPLVDELYMVFRTEKPSKDEIIELRELLKKTKHDLLALRVSAWRRDTNSLRQQIGALDEDRRREGVELLLMEDGISVDDLLCVPGARVTVVLFSELACVHPQLSDQIPSLVKRLVEIGGESLLTDLTPFLKTLKRKQLKEIEAAIGGRDKHAPKGFVKALDEALSDSRPEKKTGTSILNRLRKGLAGADKED